jgi:hypothetical protein
MTLPFCFLVWEFIMAWNASTKDGSLFDFDLIDKDFLLYISNA